MTKAEVGGANVKEEGAVASDERMAEEGEELTKRIDGAIERAQEGTRKEAVKPADADDTKVTKVEVGGTNAREEAAVANCERTVEEGEELTTREADRLEAEGEAQVKVLEEKIIEDQRENNLGELEGAAQELLIKFKA